MEAVKALRRAALLLALPLVLGAAAPAPGALERQVDATLRQAYGPYLKENGGASDWQRPVFTPATRQLIRAWMRHNGEELTGLNSFGWFCECQDWDWRAFGWKRTAIRQLAPGRIEVRVRVIVVSGSSLEQRQVLVRQGSRWLIDDLFAGDIPKGIKAAMRAELAVKPGE